ncbi:MAG: DUF3102 domain-containing protein [Verrucomicrobiota bacterium]
MNNLHPTPIPSSPRPALVSEILALHGEIIQSARTTLDKAIRIGQLLTEQKASLKHGEWLPWVKENLPFDARTAQNYTRCYGERDRLKNENVSYLADAYRMLAEPRVTERPGIWRMVWASYQEIEDANGLPGSAYKLVAEADPDFDVNQVVIPDMPSWQFERLAICIKEIGLVMPIILHRGNVLDGKYRLRACSQAGVRPRFVEFSEAYPDCPSPTLFVLWEHLNRRNLSPEQSGELYRDLDRKAAATFAPEVAP